MTSKERHELRYQRRKNKRLLKKIQFSQQYDNFNKVFSYGHLFTSYKKCSEEVKWKASIQLLLMVADLNTYETYSRLQKKIFKHDPFYEFDLLERGKLRHIKSVSARERGVQRCICDYCLVPLLSRSFIYDNGASLKNKGYTFSIRRTETHLHKYYHHHFNNNGYVLLFDFSKFFDTIQHDICFNIINNAISDQDLQNVAKDFINAFGDIGLGLGSQISQILALASVNSLDHFIKEKLHIKYYGRYMDDGYLIHQDKKYLQYCLNEINIFCQKLGIKLNLKKTMIVKLSHGFTFLKTRFYLLPSGKVIKKIYKKSIVKERRKLKKLKKKQLVANITINDIYQSFQSWRAHAKIFNSYFTIKNIEALYSQLFLNQEVIK